MQTYIMITRNKIYKKILTIQIYKAKAPTKRIRNGNRNGKGTKRRQKGYNINFKNYQTNLFKSM